MLKNPLRTAIYLFICTALLSFVSGLLPARAEPPTDRQTIFSPSATDAFAQRHRSRSLSRFWRHPTSRSPRYFISRRHTVTHYPKSSWRVSRNLYPPVVRNMRYRMRSYPSVKIRDHH